MPPELPPVGDLETDPLPNHRLCIPKDLRAENFSYFGPRILKLRAATPPQSERSRVARLELERHAWITAKCCGQA